MIEINLIPDVKQELLKAQRTRATVISASILTCIIAGGVVAALALYVFGVQFARGVISDGLIDTGYSKLSKVEDLPKMLTIQNQLGRINELNDTKQIDSRVFDVLSAVIPPAPNNVQVSNLLINAELSQLSIEGQTRSFDNLEIFKKTVDGAVITYNDGSEDKEVKLASSISTSDISYGEDASGAKVLRFTLRFVYAQELFSPTVPSLTIKLINQGNVTDSYLGIPKSIFAPRAADTSGGN